MPPNGSEAPQRGSDISGHPWWVFPSWFLAGTAPADVFVAMAICGFWALILCPLETRVRHGVPVQKTMAVIAMASALITVLGVVYSVWALTPNDLAQMGSGGITYAEFLDALPRRAHVLAGISSFGVVAVAGFVIHEVDRLSAK